MLLRRARAINRAVTRLPLNSLNGVIAYATKVVERVEERVVSQFPERSYSLCYMDKVKALVLKSVKDLSIP